MKPLHSISGALLACAGLLAGCDARATAASGIEAEPAQVSITDEGVFDAGTVDVSETIEHTFLLTNATDRRVGLGYVWKACNCTELELDKESLAPGESAAATARIRFNSQDHGPRTIQAAIYESESSRSPLARITIFARVGKPAVLTFSPSMLDLGEVERGVDIEARVVLRVIDLVGSAACVPELIGFEPSGAFEAFLDPIAKSSELNGHPCRDYSVVVKSGAGFEGRQRATLGARLRVGDVELSDRLTVQASEQPWIEFASPDLFAGRMVRGENRAIQLAVTNVLKECGDTVVCVPSQAWIQASWGGDPVTALSVTIRPPAPGRLDESVELRCGERSLTVPVRGWVD